MSTRITLRRLRRTFETVRRPDEIAALLSEIRTDRMGEPPDPSKDRAVAHKIQDWYEHPFLGTDYPSPAAFE
jgi:hypothetical protein